MVNSTLNMSSDALPSNDDLPATSGANVVSYSVTLPQGKINGLKEKAPNGSNFFLFKGIPYARPPVGDLRFKNPVELDVFPEDLDCTKDGDVSCQYDMFISKLVIGVEDCLNVNIFTPKLPTNAQALDLMPVMVFFHGGSFLIGSNALNLYNAEYLVQEGVVVVTVNYRLGPLGFAHFPGTDVDSNVGLKDQQFSLKWVRKNIDKFGGNPNNVTIFGISAGGAAVHFHYLNAESRKYFHRAIAQSGVTVNDWASHKDDKGKKFKKLAKILGCESEVDDEIVTFMRNVDPNETVRHQQEVVPSEEQQKVCEFIFGPVIDGEGGFVPKSPIEIMKEPNSINLPLIFGMTSNEGLFPVTLLPTFFEKYEAEPDRLIPTTVHCTDPEERQKLGKTIKEFYFGDKNICDETMDILIDYIGDSYMYNGFNIVAELQSKFQQSSPTYFYQFSFTGALNVFKKFLNACKYRGVSHADDCYYLFSSTVFVPEQVPIDSKDDIIRNVLIKLWTNFAKFSNPTPENKESSLPFKWSPLQQVDPESHSFKLDYLDINEDSTMKVNPNKVRAEFWKQIYAKYNGSHLNPKFD